MVIHLNLTGSVEKENRENAKLHWMPCIIKKNGEAKVSEYFEPIITKHGEDALKSSFRGYPLLGIEIKVPKNYCGIIVQETNYKLSEEADRHLYRTHMFDSFVYWNQDVEPSRNDKIISALEWLDVAEALHGPHDL